MSANRQKSYILYCNKATAAVVISHLRISNNGELKKILGFWSKITPLHIEEGVKGQSKQFEKSCTMTFYKGDLMS